MYKKISASVFLSILPLLLLAGDPILPCNTDDDDPLDNPTCPLDSWVFLLVAVVVAGTCWYYYQQKKSRLKHS